MLARGGAWRRIAPRYWVRLAWCLFTATLATILTLPERLVLAPVLRHRFRRTGAGSLRDQVRVVCILGYYRSGTTHLHYLLSCDPGLATPRWYQVLAPQGWVVSWLFLRWFLVPFLGSTRPQDDVAIGPEWPAEDDFALSNWTLSSTLPGRMILPREWDRSWKALHDLREAAPADRRRWRMAAWALAWKVARAGRVIRPVILKTPAHTARIPELVEVFGVENIRFIHIARDPAAVLRSNLAMHRRFGPYLLQELPDDDVLRRRIIEEYDATERRFLESAASLPAGMLARIRYQDLVADPVGQVRAAYRQLGLNWTDAAERRMEDYLRDVAGYRSAQSRSPRASDAAPPELAWMYAAFGHERPTVEPRPVSERAAAAAPSTGPLSVAVDTLIVALLLAAAWIGVAWLLRDRLDWMTWPVGAVLGGAAIGATGGRGGSVRLGVWTALLTAGVLGAVAYPATCLAFYRGREPMPWGDVWDSTRDGLLAVNNLIWLFLGVMTAYRLASRAQARPPGG